MESGRRGRSEPKRTPAPSLSLGLASLGSVRQAAERFRANHPCLNLLINNAGVIHPGYAQTEDGFELHFGTNHLGHFANYRLAGQTVPPVN
jgi:NAD(P)-dependent dehydrogenase (short-subunit alcohol dehydrogenase family)